jgi:hypothetical protein
MVVGEVPITVGTGLWLASLFSFGQNGGVCSTVEPKVA